MNKFHPGQSIQSISRPVISGEILHVLTSFFDAEWRAFSNVLSNHHKALRSWIDFHAYKIDIVGLRVLLA